MVLPNKRVCLLIALKKLLEIYNFFKFFGMIESLLTLMLKKILLFAPF